MEKIDENEVFEEEMNEEMIEDLKQACFAGRVRHLVSRRFCNHQRNYIKCPCMCMLKMDKNKYYFDVELLNDLTAICQELRFRQFSHTDNYEAGSFYYRHVVVIVALTTKDKNLVCDPAKSRISFLNEIYELREHYGMNNDFGQKKMINDDDFHAQTIGESFSGMVEMLKNAFKTSLNTVSELVDYVFVKVVDMLKTVIGLISDTLSKIVDKLFSWLRKSLIKIFDPVEYIKESLPTTSKGALIISLSVIIIFVVIQMLGLFAFNCVEKLIDTLIAYFKREDLDDDDSCKAQSPQGPMAGVITLISLIVGLTASDMKTVSTKCREFTNLVVAGLSGSAFLGSMFLCLPIAIQTACSMKFGTSETKEKVLVDEWLLKATAVTRLKKIPKVLVSDEYYKWVSDLVTESQMLRSKIRSPTVSTTFVRMLVSLMEILAMLENYNKEKSFRDYPYSLHICAPPGYGKTLFSSKFIKDLFNTEERQVFTRPISDEFWSGFIDQKVILFDEFLIGDEEVKIRHALEYLEVVSTKCFKPPLASVDDLSVGVKGTRCEPLGVVSINNTPYSQVANIPRDALFRRRMYVVQCRINRKYQSLLKDSALDLKRLSDDEIRNVAWLSFDLLPSVPNSRQPIENLSYPDLIRILREKYEEHRNICERLRTGLHETVDSSATPQDLLEDAMRTLRGIPNEEKNFTDLLFNLLSSTGDKIGDLFKFSSQGPSEMGDQEMDEKDLPKPKGPSEKRLYNILKKIKNDVPNLSREGAIARYRSVEEQFGRLPPIMSDDQGEDRRRVEQMMIFKAKRLGLSHPFCSQYETASDISDDLPPRIQKDIISDIVHTNVDPNQIHRHACLGIKTEIVRNRNGQPLLDVEGNSVIRTLPCTSNFAHKHPPGLFHDFLCPSCKNDGNKQSFVRVHGGPNLPKFQRMPDLLPYDYESCFIMDDDAYKKNMDDLWNKVLLDKYLSFGYLPLLFVENKEDDEDTFYYEIPSRWDYSKKLVKNTAKWILIFSVIRGIVKFFRKDKKEINDSICFGSQSFKGVKTTVKGRSQRIFTQAHAQSGDGLIFEIDGKCFHAIPLRGHTFLTYYHSFLREEDCKLIPDNTPIVIRWKGKSDIVLFDSSMTQCCPADDLMFFTFNSNKIHAFPDITKRFWTNEDCSSFQCTSATVEISGSPKYITVGKVNNKNYSFSKIKFEMSEALMYRYPTMRGDCGSPVVSVGQNFPNKIMGMHVAGGSREGDKFGLAVIITREDIENALKIKKENYDDVVMECQGPILEKAPNLLMKKKVVEDEIVHIPRVSKIYPSEISEYLPWKPRKYKPIMSERDPRSQGQDPMIKALNIALMVDHDSSELDMECLKRASDSTYNSYRTKLTWPIGRRRLTFEEALMGIPGVLASIKVQTSPGYPLCKLASKKGKRSFFEFGIDGQLWYSESFRQQCEDYLREMETEGVNERRFIAYLKDELVSSSKIAKCKTRLIYAGDLVSNVAYRMVFGSLLAAFNNSYEKTPMSIGMNQYSYDMHMIYDYLTEVGKNFVAGDIDEWDKHIFREVLSVGYSVFTRLADDLTNEMGMKSFVLQQNFSPSQFDDQLVYFQVTYFSGLFLTSIMNNINHEIYLRYMFEKAEPNRIFDDHVRLKLGGDDHIYCFSDLVKDSFTPFKIRDYYKQLGHTYTSDIKDQDLVDEFRSFEDITFLGAYPKLLYGKYCGALKKTTIEEMVHWTRNRNLSLLQDCKMAMEFASLWGEDYYYQFVNDVNHALLESGFQSIMMPSCFEMARIMSLRTAGSSEDYPYGFFAQGPPVNSLVKLNEHKVIDGKVLNQHQNSLSNKALNELPMDINFGTESRVFRGQFLWSNSNVPGTPIFTVDVPFGLLSLGNADNVQNMGFDRFVFWEGDIEISFQINGTPFQQGLLVAYFVPLADYPIELANITSCSHVKIQPDQSSTYTLTIPYIYLRSVMNTISRDTESLGTIFVTPLSPLNSVTLEDVTVSVYSAFPGSRFTIPRPLDAESGRNKFYTVEGKEKLSVLQEFDGPFEAQGNVSSTNISNYWSNVGGDMPIQDITNTAAAEATQDLSADVKIPMPLDNPPLSSGAIPVEQAFPGMANSYGVRPTTDLQLKPATLARQQMEIFNPTETKIESLLGQQTLLTKLNVSTEMAPGTELYKITLNTRCGIAEGSNIPINIAILNQFMFWRCDFELTFVAVQTKFHSVRLQALMAYGAPGLVLASRNVSFTSNMSFSANDESTNYSHTEVIPYNAQTEFLRTYEGEAVTDPIQNYSLGTFAVYVVNSLIAPSTVVGDIEVLVFLRFLNPKVAVPRPNSPFTWNNYLEYIPSIVYGFRGTVGDGEFRNAPLLNRIVPSNFPVVPLTSVQWQGDIPAPAMYDLLAPKEFTFVFRGTEGGTFTRLVNSVVVTDTSLVFQSAILDDLTFESDSSYVFTGDFTFIVPIMVSDFEAQGPSDAVLIEEVNKPNTGEVTEDAERIVMTHEQTNERENKPCRWEIGSKFEFTISDIHEVARRYIRIVPINNVGLDQFSVLTRNVSNNNTIFNLNVPVQPQSMWRGLFAAWAGSVKFRIFRNTNGGFPQVLFVPFYNRDVTQPGIPIIDAMQGIDFVAYTTSYTSVSSITGPLAREVLYPISNAGYIDVSAPFQSHYNFCYNSKTQVIAPISSGTLVMSYVGTEEPVVFSAFGDDLRLGVFRPPKTTTFNMSIFRNGIGGFSN